MKCQSIALSVAGVAVATAALLAMPAAAPAQDAHGAATSCLVEPLEGPAPPHVRRARERMMTRGDEHPGGWALRTDQLARARRDFREGRRAKAPEGAALNVATGDLRFPVLPMRFMNTASEPWNPVSLEAQLFLFGPTGTLTEYYDEVSYGNLNVSGDVWGWQPSLKNDTYYEDGVQGLFGNVGGLVLEAVTVNDPWIDYGQYDNDGPDNIPNSGDDDGYADVVFVVHSELGGECPNSATNLWSHQWFLSRHDESYETNDASANGGNVRVNRYCIVPAFNCDGMSMINIGVFAHELGHALGIMDLYDTVSPADSDGIGVWGLMGAGNSNTSTSPAHMTAWTKHRLGWLNYLNLAQDDPLLCIPPVETNPLAVRLWAQGKEASEYFLVENRQKLGFDQNLMNEGLVIYHVDDARYDALRDLNTVNADETRKAIDVECADAMLAGHVANADDLDIRDDSNRGDSLDVWCQQGGGDTFDGNSIPDSRSYSGNATGVAVRTVGPCNGVGQDGGELVCASFEVGVSNPVDVCLNDCEGGFCNAIATCDEWWGSPDIRIDHDGDGDDDYPTPGVDNRIVVRVANTGTELAVATTAQIYFARGAMGLVWPDDAEQMVGVTGYPVLEPGESEWASLVFEYPEFPEGGGHYCIGAVLQQTDDPTNPSAANLSNNVAQVNHSILMDRGSLGAPAQSPVLAPRSFETARDAGAEAARAGGCGSVYCETWIHLYDGPNPSQNSVAAEVRVGTPPNYNDAVIPPGWNLEFNPQQGPFFLSPAEFDSIQVILWSNSATSGQVAHVPLTLWDLDSNQPMGGTTIDAHADCLHPAGVQNAVIDWIAPEGDFPIGPNVLLEWTPVELDVSGNPETISHYEVYRKKDAGLYFLVDRVAVDADLTRPGFQWYDELPPGQCPATWTYQVSAVDAAGSFGPPSLPQLLECTLTPVGAPEVATTWTDRLLPSRPNPVRTTTEIGFEMARAGDVTVAIYNLRGERVRDLWAGRRAAGGHRLTWDGRGDGGKPLANGVYFARAELPSGVETRKVVLMR